MCELHIGITFARKKRNIFLCVTMCINYEKKVLRDGVVYFPTSASPRGVSANQFSIRIGFDLDNL